MIAIRTLFCNMSIVVESGLSKNASF